MPVLDGISAAEMLAKNNVALVVFVTAFSNNALVRRASDVGVMAYLMSPLRDNDLQPAIEMAVSRFREYKVLSKEVAKLSGRLETRKVIPVPRDCS